MAEADELAEARVGAPPRVRAAWPWIALICVLFVASAAMRTHNARTYFIDHGFDESFNWEYIRQLTQSWELPDPESLWSAARPPLFFYVGGALARVVGPQQVASMHAIRLASSAFGLLAIALAVWLVWRASPADLRRTAIASGLLLFVPAHIHLSAMVNEEITVASWTTLALVLALWDRAEGSADGSGWQGWLRVAGIGVAGGLAFLTKLSGCIVVVAVAFAIVVDGWRARALGPALARAAALSSIALVVGGWFYARSLIVNGYLYPHSLEAHSIILSMPPGDRSIVDYLRIPWEVFTSTRVDSPALLHSVWGGTYLTWWFDGQRHFVPRSHPNVERMGMAILVLAILPTAASIAGALRGIRRARRAPGTLDAPMLSLTGFMLAGYVLYTLRNPWFACVKGSYLLGLMLPYAYWASDCLSDWTRGSRPIAMLVWLDLALLVAAVAAAFTFGTPLWPMTLGKDFPGLPWLPDQP